MEHDVERLTDFFFCADVKVGHGGDRKKRGRII
jgi:hypothetical protein